MLDKAAPELSVTTTGADALIARVTVRREADGGLTVDVAPGMAALVPRLRTNVAKLHRELARELGRPVSLRLLEAED